jgi:hypothetical protein
LRTSHLPSAAIATSAPPTQNRLQAFLVIPPDLFALFRWRSMGGRTLSDVRPVFL